MREGRGRRTVHATRSAWRRLPDAARAAVVAVAMAVFLFPEIVLAGGSLSMIPATGVIDAPREASTVALRPDFEDRRPEYTLRDVGSQVWQFEATTRHMRNVVRTGQDPFWNPWTASGQRGPETLVGMQLSPVTLAIAFAGASVTAFTAVLLAIVVLALWCIQRFVTVVLGGPRVAAVAAGAVYSLNGWAIASLGGLTGVPYLLFPLVLYTLTTYRRTPGPLRLLAVVAAHVALVTSTFLPGVVLVLVAAHGTALVLAAADRAHDRPGRAGWVDLAARAGRSLLAQLAPVVAAGVVAAVVLVPLAAALLDAGADMDRYAERGYQAQDPLEYLTVLTPRHAFTSFLPDTFPDQVPPYSWTVHLGLVPLLVLAAAWRPSSGRDRWLLASSLAMVALSIVVHLGTPVTGWLLHVPLGGTIGTAYWSSLAGMAATVGVAVAVGVGRSSGWDWRAGGIAGGAMLAALGVGVVANDPSRRSAIALALAIGTVTVAVVLLVAGTRRPGRRHVLAAALVGLLVLELVSYQNPVRYERREITADLPDYVGFVKANVGDGRILSSGTGAIHAEWGAALRIRQVETMTHVQIPEYTVFFSDRVEGKPVDRFLRTPDRGREPFRAQPEALDLLGVRYLVVHRAYRDFLAGVAEQYPVAFEDDAARVTVFENPDAYPRVRLASRLVPTATPSEQPRWSATVAVSGDRELLAAARETGVDVGHLPGTDGGSEDGADPGVARITSETSTEVRVAVDAARPAVLVLGDAFHADWHATIDGEDAPLGLVDETLRGVVVPAGSSEVVFSYRPVARDLGAAVSVVGILGLLGVAGAWALRDRRRAAAGVSRLGRARARGARSRPA